MKNALACCLVSGLLAAGVATAQIKPPAVEQPDANLNTPATYPPTVATSGSGPYMAPPAWAQTLTPQIRFTVLTNMSDDAVLDRETGLVWARVNAYPFPLSPAGMEWRDARDTCRDLQVGNRTGWRLPTTMELMSLIDFAVPFGGGELRFLPGYPFVVAPTDSQGRIEYWTRDRRNAQTWVVDLTTGQPRLLTTSNASAGALCVRGRE
jgi:hypothetical protein